MKKLLCTLLAALLLASLLTTSIAEGVAGSTALPALEDLPQAGASFLDEDEVLGDEDSYDVPLDDADDVPLDDSDDVPLDDADDPEEAEEDWDEASAEAYDAAYEEEMAEVEEEAEDFDGFEAKEGADGEMPTVEDETLLGDIDEDEIMPEEVAPQATAAPAQDPLEALMGMPTVSDMTKADVRFAQQALIMSHYLEGSADGVLGDMTRAAVQRWYADHGLSADGESPFTLLVRMRRINPASDPANDAFSIYIVQRLLHQWCFLLDEPDGKLGKNTSKALKRYMEYNQGAMASFLTARENAVAKTRQTSTIDDGMPLVEDELLTTTQTFSTNGTLTQAWYDFITCGYIPRMAVVRAGSKGIDALRVQYRLHALKYIYGGMDGVYGRNSYLAMAYFQRRNGLPATGECDQATAEVLFSGSAKPSDVYVASYMARVNTKKSRVYILKWTGNGYGDVVKTFVCSCGKPSTPTLKGTYQAKGPVSDWYYMPTSRVWVRYAFQIKGNYFFHSVLFNSKGAKRPTYASVHNLGSNVSHGCIRLAVNDAAWIFKNCAAGMTVTIE